LTPMTKGARKAARIRKRPRFRRSQAWVSSSYFLAAPSPAFLDLCGCNMATSMSSSACGDHRSGCRGQSLMPRLPFAKWDTSESCSRCGEGRAGALARPHRAATRVRGRRSRSRKCRWHCHARAGCSTGSQAGLTCPGPGVKSFREFLSRLLTKPRGGSFVPGTDTITESRSPSYTTRGDSPLDLRKVNPANRLATDSPQTRLAPTEVQRSHAT